MNSSWRCGSSTTWPYLASAVRGELDDDVFLFHKLAVNIILRTVWADRSGCMLVFLLKEVSVFVLRWIGLSPCSGGSYEWLTLSTGWAFHDRVGSKDQHG